MTPAPPRGILGPMDGNDQRTKVEKYGPVVVGVAVLGSAVVVGGWFMFSGGGEGKVGMGGFDIASAPETRRISADAPGAATAPAAPASSLGMVKRDEDMMDPARTPAASPKPGAPAADAKADPKAAAAAGFQEAVKKSEAAARAFSDEMEQKYPSVRQYARDWVSYPDLRDLTAQWHRDKDSIKFAYGVARSDNFGKLVQKYATDPGVHAYLVEGVKRAPGELVGSLGNICSNDAVIKDLASTVARAAGLPPSITALIGGVAPGTQAPDASKVVGELLNDPRARQAAPPVSAGSR